MKLENTFTVPVTADVAWRVLLDVERIAPCMPGATLTGREGDDFTGTVKVKVGPVSLTYGGKATFASLDEDEPGGGHRSDRQGDPRIGHREGGHHRENEGNRRFDPGRRRDRSDHHRKTGSVRPWRDGGDQRQADHPVRRLPRRHDRRPRANRHPLRTCPSGGRGSFAATGATDSHGRAGARQRDGIDGATTGSATPIRPTPEAIDLLGTAGLPVLKRLVPLLAVVGVVLGILVVRRRRS